jgi:hypothetical protein
MHAAADQVGDAVHERFCLSRSRPGDDQQRRIAVADRMALRLVEALQDLGLELHGDFTLRERWNWRSASVDIKAGGASASALPLRRQFYHHGCRRRQTSLPPHVEDC